MLNGMNKCPICGQNGQLLFSSFDCTNTSCDNYKDQYPEIKIGASQFLWKMIILL